jgi:hypothetical protein
VLLAVVSFSDTLSGAILERTGSNICQIRDVSCQFLTSLLLFVGIFELRDCKGELACWHFYKQNKI